RRAPRSTLFPYTTLFRSWIEVRSRLCRKEVQRLQRGQRCTVRTLRRQCIEAVGGRQYASAKADLLSRNAVRIAESIPPLVVVLRSEEHTSELQSRENLVC